MILGETAKESQIEFSVGLVGFHLIWQTDFLSTVGKKRSFMYIINLAVPFSKLIQTHQ